MRKQEVLIHYVNQPTPAAPYCRIMEWLRDTNDREYLAMADRLEEDLTQFPAALIRDANLLLSTPGSDKLAVVLVNNLLARAGRFEYRRPGESDTRFGEFSVPKFPYGQFSFHPLSHPETYLSLLVAVAAVFGKDVNYSLVTKSHGSERLALTSLLSRCLADRDSESFFQHLRDGLQNTNDNVRSRFMVPSVKGKRTDYLGEMILEELANGIGTDKHQLAHSLSMVGNQGIVFDSVVLESCSSSLRQVPTCDLPKNVGKFYCTDSSLPYASIDYGRLVSEFVSGKSLGVALAASLPPELQLFAP